MAQKVRAAYDFDAQPGSGELTIRQDEILTVIRENIEGGWMEGRNNKGQVGLFPESYVVKVQSGPSAPPPNQPPPPLPATYSQPPPASVLPPLPAQFGPTPTFNDDWGDPRVPAAPTTPVYPTLPPPSSLPNPASAPSLQHQALASTQSAAAPLHDDDFDDDWSDEDEEVAETPNAAGGAPVQQRQVSRSRSAGPDTISNSGKPGASRMKTINRFSNFVKSGMEAYILTQSKMASEPGERHEVIMKDGRIMWAPPPQRYTCVVDKPKKESKLKGLKSFIAYSVTSSLTNIQVSRRYKHFDWLHEQLSNKYLLIPIPPLPEKQVSGRYEEDLIEHRKCILQLWVDKICRHPVLSQSEVWQHFITTTDEKKWKNGKRSAEKDEYVGGNFFNCVSVPNQPIDNPTAERQIESFVKTVRSLDDSIKNLYVCATETQKRLIGPYKANWQKMAAALDALGQSFQLDHSSAPVKSAIAQSANVLHKIGAQHEDHGKKATEQLMDFIYTYKGVLSGIPDVVNIHKSAFAKLNHNERLMMEGKLSPQEAEAIHRRVDVITYAMLAEINHISQEVNDDFRHSLGTYFAQEADFYLNIGQQLGKLAEAYKK